MSGGNQHGVEADSPAATTATESSQFDTEPRYKFNWRFWRFWRVATLDEAFGNAGMLMCEVFSIA